MNNYLFRWKTLTWEWVYGDLVHDAFDWTSSVLPVWIKSPGCYPVEVLPESVWQWTGLMDKKKAKIFSWDILEMKDWTRNPYTVSWSEKLCGWSMDWKPHGLSVFLSEYVKDMEIIWNITDNPELSK